MPYLPMPPPLPYEENVGFWAGCKRHELVIDRCSDCKTYRHPPMPLCPTCQSWNRQWTKISGRGRVHSFTIVTRALFPGMAVPYNVAHIELEEQKGLIMLGNVIDCSPEEIRIDLPVEVTFEDISPQGSIYYFKKAGS